MWVKKIIRLFPEILKFDNTSKAFKLHENISHLLLTAKFSTTLIWYSWTDDTENILQFVCFFTCSREEKQTCLSDTQWDIFKLTHGNEPRTSTGRTVWSIWEKIVCAAGSNSTWCLLTSDGQSEASWNTETFVQELYWSVKTIWNHLHSDTCWPLAMNTSWWHFSVIQWQRQVLHNSKQNYFLYQTVSNHDHRMIWGNSHKSKKRKTLSLLKTTSCDCNDQCAKTKFAPCSNLCCS